MKIMKRISLSIALIMASLFSLSAQDADYKSMTLTFAELKEVHATIPTQITIAASDSDAIEVSLQKQQAPKKGIRKLILRDVRLFLNSVNHSLDLVRGAGIDAKAEQAETEHEIVLTIRLPKRVG